MLSISRQLINDLLSELQTLYSGGNVTYETVGNLLDRVNQVSNSENSKFLDLETVDLYDLIHDDECLIAYKKKVGNTPIIWCLALWDATRYCFVSSDLFMDDISVGILRIYRIPKQLTQE